MTVSSVMLKNANRLADQRRDKSVAFHDPEILMILHYLYDHEPQDIQTISVNIGLPIDDLRKVVAFCEDVDLVKSDYRGISLTTPTRRRVAYTATTLDFLVKQTLTGDSNKLSNPLPGTYFIKECIGQGATSYTFLATQESTHRDRTLKVFLPEFISFEKLKKALERRAQISDQAIPEIIDSGELQIQFPNGRSEILPCVVFRYIEGNTFSRFLKEAQNISSAILERFIKCVGGALAEIEDVGLIHGDLHEGNILVELGTEPTVAQKFWVIDFIGVPSVASPQIEVRTDINNFRDHLLQAALIACKLSSGVSARRVLGDRVFRILQGLRDGQYNSFHDMLTDFHKERIAIPANHFQTPRQEPFEWLRVEWISSPEWLYKLFEPDQTRYETIARFGNTWVSGPRGCGKSHYLRVLGFYPATLTAAEDDIDLSNKLKKLNHDFKSTFGVLFACRLGEFKGFTPEAIGETQFDVVTQAFLKHIVVLKIWNKTLSTLQEGIEHTPHPIGQPILEPPSNLEELRSFLEERLGTMAIVEDADVSSVFRQCLNISTARENSAIAVWDLPSKRPGGRLLNEEDLDAFFGILKRTFPDLRESRFYVLVDDASVGHIDYEMQKVLNSLVRAAQANHCFKITCEKFMYTLDTSDGRAIDPRHEVTYVDLGEVSTKTQRKTAINLSEYMARVVNARLKAANYKADIQTILGKSQSATEFLSGLSKPKYVRGRNKQASSRSSKRSIAYYAGWNIIWNISHGSVRTLLELVEHIFKVNGATSDITNISLRNQDAAVRSYSTRQFKALSMLPGEIKDEPLGERLRAIISAIGEMSHQYFTRYDTGEEGRWYETISIERLDRSKLDREENQILINLVKYGLLLDDGVTFSRAQLGLSQRYDMNKIFSPAFETTYRVRNHLYLSRQRFKELLSMPDIFLKRHRNKLSELANRNKSPIQRTLFEAGHD